MSLGGNWIRCAGNRSSTSVAVVAGDLTHQPGNGLFITLARVLFFDGRGVKLEDKAEALSL